MVVVGELVNPLDCGSRKYEFEPRQLPQYVELVQLVERETDNFEVPDANSGLHTKNN